MNNPSSSDSDYSHIRSKFTQNATICHFLYFILIPWLFFKIIVRNEFLTSDYPEIKGMHMNIALQDQVLDSDPLFMYIMYSLCQ